MSVENVVIIGSGPAGWAAAIYAARANLNPLVYQGDSLWEANRHAGTMPLGQRALTTEVENSPSWPGGALREYLKPAPDPDRQPSWVQANKPQPGHTIHGHPLMELMRKQAV